MGFTENRNLHFIGICGKAMGGIAAALAQQGWKVTGSDEASYPPMKEFLQSLAIEIMTPYRAENIPRDVSSVIVGKRIVADNPELRHAIDRGLTYLSFPEFLSKYFLWHSKNAVVAGGVGKTTTSAMLTWILEANDLEPDYLVGGLCKNLPMPARFSGAEIAVLEGDEYSSCFHDPQPKFSHYLPETVIVTNIIEDHPDIYSRLEDLVEVFGQLAEKVPKSGCLILSDDDPSTAMLSARACGEVVTVGTKPSATERITEVQLKTDHSSFRFMGNNFKIPLCGLMNIHNAAMASVAAAHWGLPAKKIVSALRTFRGVRNRQEVQQFGSLHIIHDKASHPYALTALAQAARQRFPGRRIVSIIQPRATGGKDWVYQKNLPEALSLFDKVILTGSYEHNPHRKQSWADDPFCIESLAGGLSSKSIEVARVKDFSQINEILSDHVLHEDVVVVSLLEQSVSERDAINKALQQFGLVEA